MSYIVGLNRDRDSYQVARALVEVGELEQLVTDYYVGVLPREIPGLGHRQTPDIPPEKVTASVRAFAAQLPYEVGRRLRPIDSPSRFVESALGATIARVARRQRTTGLRRAVTGPTHPFPVPPEPPVHRADHGRARRARGHASLAPGG